MMFGTPRITNLFMLAVLLPVHVYATDISLDRQAELLHLLRQDCGACHGMTLKGGLGLPLTVDKLQDKPHELLVQIILNGLDGTPMPPWKGILDEEEASWLVTQLKTGVSEDD